MKSRIKECLRKILIVLLVFMIINNYLMPNVVCASVGGVLLEPIFDLVTLIDDTILSMLQGTFMTGAEFIIDAKVEGDANERLAYRSFNRRRSGCSWNCN